MTIVDLLEIESKEIEFGHYFQIDIIRSSQDYRKQILYRDLQQALDYYNRVASYISCGSVSLSIVFEPIDVKLSAHKVKIVIYKRSNL